MWELETFSFYKQTINIKSSVKARSGPEHIVHSFEKQKKWNLEHNSTFIYSITPHCAATKASFYDLVLIHHASLVRLQLLKSEVWPIQTILRAFSERKSDIFQQATFSVLTLDTLYLSERHFSASCARIQRGVWTCYTCFCLIWSESVSTN